MEAVIMAALALVMAGAALSGALLLLAVLRESERPAPQSRPSDEELRQWEEFLNYTGGKDVEE